MRGKEESRSERSLESFVHRSFRASSRAGRRGEGNRIKVATGWQTSNADSIKFNGQLDQEGQVFFFFSS